jgi:hypothetical protein
LTGLAGRSRFGFGGGGAGVRAHVAVLDCEQPVGDRVEQRTVV